MIRTALLITALCLAISLAKDITLLIKKGVNKDNDPPYVSETNVTGLSDNATLLDAMKMARSEGNLRFTGKMLYGDYFIISINGIHAKPVQFWRVLGGATNFKIIAESPNKWNPTSGERVLFKRVVIFDLDDSEDADQASLTCAQRRANAIRDHRIGEYIPQCNAEGNYELRQCWGSAGSCWCVKEVTGRQIPHTLRGPTQNPLRLNCYFTEGSMNQTTNRTRAGDRQDAMSCFKYNHRSKGPVLKLTDFSNEGACIDFCLATDGCQAAVMKPETNWTDKPECFAVGNYYVVPARRWAIAQRQCFDKKGWLPVNRGEYHDQDMENSSLEIRTKSKSGSNQHAIVDFVNNEKYFAGGFRIRFWSQPEYYLSGCSGWFPFHGSLTTTREKIWRITLDKSAGIHVIIHCNGVQVLDVTLSDEKCSRFSSWRDYWSRNATKIYFPSSDTASQSYRTYSD